MASATFGALRFGWLGRAFASPIFLVARLTARIAVMVSPLRVALFGWSLGFLAAGLLGLTQHANHRLATILLIPAGVGSALLLVLVLADVVRNRGHHDWVDLDDVDGPEHIPAPPTAGVAASTAAVVCPDAPAIAVTAAQEVAASLDADSAVAARIAALEDRLAAEQEQLDEMIHALAEADAAVLTEGHKTDLTDEEAAAAVELEPVLRQQVLDALVELVGNADMLPELESLTSPKR